MKILTGVLEALKQPGIDQTEVIRLRSLIQAVKIYKELFADYVHYRETEAELVKLRRAHERLVKKANDDPKAHVNPILVYIHIDSKTVLREE